MMRWIVSKGSLDHWAFLEKEGQAVDEPVTLVLESELDGKQAAIDLLERRADFYRRRMEAMEQILREPPQCIADLIEAMESRCPEDVIAKAVGCTFLSEIEKGDS